MRFFYALLLPFVFISCSTLTENINNQKNIMFPNKSCVLVYKLKNDKNVIDYYSEYLITYKSKTKVIEQINFNENRINVSKSKMEFDGRNAIYTENWNSAADNMAKSEIIKNEYSDFIVKDVLFGTDKQGSYAINERKVLSKNDGVAGINKEGTKSIEYLRKVDFYTDGKIVNSQNIKEVYIYNNTNIPIKIMYYGNSTLEPIMEFTLQNILSIEEFDRLN